MAGCSRQATAALAPLRRAKGGCGGADTGSRSSTPGHLQADENACRVWEVSVRLAIICCQAGKSKRALEVLSMLHRGRKEGVCGASKRGHHLQCLQALEEQRPGPPPYWPFECWNLHGLPHNLFFVGFGGLWQRETDCTLVCMFCSFAFKESDVALRMLAVKYLQLLDSNVHLFFGKVHPKIAGALEFSTSQNSASVCLLLSA